MLKIQKCVYDFMRALDLPCGGAPGTKMNFRLLQNLVKEETEEFHTSMHYLEVVETKISPIEELSWSKYIIDGTLAHAKKTAPSEEAMLILQGALELWLQKEPEKFEQHLRLYWWAEVIDAICDSLVVLMNAANAMGLDIEPFFDEVHRTNMAKVGGPIRSDGKRLKPEGWEPPKIKEMLEKLIGEQP